MKLADIIQNIPLSKALLIDEIMETVHPGKYSLEGLSWYVGGMRDTGEWYIEKLAELPEKTLQRIIDDDKEDKRLAEEERKKDEQLREEMGDDAYYAMRYEEQKQALIKMSHEMETYLMWGNPNKDK